MMHKERDLWFNKMPRVLIALQRPVSGTPYHSDTGHSSKAGALREEG